MFDASKRRSTKLFIFHVKCFNKQSLSANFASSLLNTRKYFAYYKHPFRSQFLKAEIGSVTIPEEFLNVEEYNIHSKLKQSLSMFKLHWVVSSIGWQNDSAI